MGGGEFGRREVRTIALKLYNVYESDVHIEDVSFRFGDGQDVALKQCDRPRKRVVPGERTTTLSFYAEPILHALDARLTTREKGRFIIRDEFDKEHKGRLISVTKSMLKI